ncbi:MAG: hypothetical protein QW463_05665 [Candidatus Caldarchaeum sp.]
MSVGMLYFVEQVLRIPDVSVWDLSRDGRWALLNSNISGSYQVWSFDFNSATCVKFLTATNG